MHPTPPVYQNIVNQPLALQESLAHHRGPGREALYRGAGLLAEAFALGRPLVVVAIGASHSGALPFVQRLSAAGLNVVLEDASEFLHASHTGYLRRPVAAAPQFMLVSRSGATVEIVRALRRLHDHGCRVFGVTNVAGSPLAQEADASLFFGGPNDHIIAIQTYLTTLLALDLLADAVLSALSYAAPDPSGYAELIPLVRQTVDHFHSHIETWQAQPKGRWVAQQAAYVLGRGASLAAVAEGALLFHEMARFPAAGLSAGSFRHGLWEVVDERLACFVFSPPDPVAALNHRLAADLVRLGARTVLIDGPHPARAAGQDSAAPPPAPEVETWTLPAAALRWAPYLQIIPLQWFTYALALHRGLTPGVFRTSQPVILSED